MEAYSEYCKLSPLIPAKLTTKLTQQTSVKNCGSVFNQRLILAFIKITWWQEKNYVY